MPYPTLASLPEAVKGLPKHGQEIWRAAYNSAFEQYGGDEGKANAVAWAAVKEKYRKNEEGEWVKKMKKEEKEMKFTKIEECPEGVKNLTEDAQKTWMEIAGKLVDAGDTEAFACERAWQAVKENWEQDGEGKWVKKVPAVGGSPMLMSLDDPTHEIKGVEIFASGKWNGDDYTEADIDEIVKNFDNKVLKNVPLKVGHDPKQKISGEPAVGIIQRVYRAGKKLLADISNIPKLVADLINKKAYHSVSSEIAWNADFDGNICRRLLTGVAILGAEVPAVNKLEEIPTVYKAEFSKVAVFEVDAGIIKEYAEWDAAYINDLPDSAFAIILPGGEKDEDGKTVPRDLRKLPYKNAAGEIDKPHLRNALARLPQADLTDAQKAAAKKKLVAAAKEAEIGEYEKEWKEMELEEQESKETDEMKAKLAESEEAKNKAEDELAQMKVEQEKKDIEEFAAKLVDKKKIVPAVKDRIVRSLLDADNSLKKEYIIGETKAEETARENLMKFYSDMQKMEIFGEIAHSEENTAESDEDKLVSLSKKYAKEQGASFKDAYLAICKRHPELIKPARNIKEKNA